LYKKRAITTLDEKGLSNTTATLYTGIRPFPLVGAASSREYRISTMLPPFITAGSRSYKGIAAKKKVAVVLTVSA